MLSGNFAMDLEDQPSETNFASLDAANEITSEWRRTEVTEAKNPKLQFELQYKSDFNGDEDHSLVFSSLGSFFGKDQSSDFLDESISGADNDAQQKTRTDFKEGVFTFKLDYTRPFSKNCM